MYDIDKNWIINFKSNGFHIQKQYFDPLYLNELNNISNSVIKLDFIGNFIGLGNRTYRNGNIFTGNILFKHQKYYDLLNNLLNIPDSLLEDYSLSEYKIISSYNHYNFKYWWHQDYPYNLVRDRELKGVNVGIIVPLISFNKTVGSTIYIPKSHELKQKPQNLIETEFYENSQYLETKLGDIFIYNGELWHSGSPNRSNQVRNLISIQFVKKFIPPCEDMKIQYYQCQKNVSMLKKIMTDYHTPHINKFGVNRGWKHTIWRNFFIFSYTYRIILELNRFYWITRKSIYQFILKLSIN